MTDEGIWSAAVKRPLDVNSLDVAGIDGVDDEDMPTIRALCKVWRDRYPYNLIRSSYYFGPLPVQGLRHQHPRPDPRERERVRRLASQGGQGARRPERVRRMGSRRHRPLTAFAG